MFTILGYNELMNGCEIRHPKEIHIIVLDKSYQCILKLIHLEIIYVRKSMF
jgi:hypothetical protein